MTSIWVSGRHPRSICSEPICRSTDHHAWSGPRLLRPWSSMPGDS
ncbi:hypothetical protein CsSME_00017929 [Camellia sinensis var. sinensis]